jgi:NAD(P)-dependent dehydrogenase (short-subunit alcohol dehydrogenase family)
MGRIEDKVALVTGGASGMGRATVELFATEGARVVVADIKGAEAIAAEVGNGAIGITTDVTRETDVADMVERAIQAFGRLDILCNNAGIGGELASFLDTATEEYDRVVAVNQTGVFYGIKHGIAAIVRGGGGAIVNTASIAGLGALKDCGAYSASKAAVIALTKTAAREYAHAGVRVNAICPGSIDTPLLQHHLLDSDVLNAVVATVPLGRVGKPQDIANAMLFLASDESSYITGAVLPVDGGYLLN